MSVGDEERKEVDDSQKTNKSGSKKKTLKLNKKRIKNNKALENNPQDNS